MKESMDFFIVEVFTMSLLFKTNKNLRCHSACIIRPQIL